MRDHNFESIILTRVKYSSAVTLLVARALIVYKLTLISEKIYHFTKKNDFVWLSQLKFEKR